MSEQIKEKKAILRQLGVRLSKSDKAKLDACTNRVQLDNCARSMIMR